MIADAFIEDGKRIRCLIKTSMRGRISFKRRDDGTWSGLSETDRVVVAAPNKRQEGADVFIGMFRQETLMKAFEANYAAMKRAGSVDAGKAVSSRTGLPLFMRMGEAFGGLATDLAVRPFGLSR